MSRRKNYLCLMLNRHPRTSDSALLLWEEKQKKVTSLQFHCIMSNSCLAELSEHSS